MRTKTRTTKKRRSGINSASPLDHRPVGVSALFVRPVPASFRICLILLCICGLHPSLSASGQKSPAPVSRVIEGSVLDRTGHPLPGAVVLIEDLKSLQVRSYIVQNDGKYHFRGLSSDANYQLRARYNGAMSGAKTVSVFESKPAIVVNLTVALKPKRATPPVH
jgi:hypothetical protein